MNIRYVRKKIKSVSNVQKITRAMQLVSAVKMKKAQQQTFANRPYQELLERMMIKINKRLDNQVSPLLTTQNESAKLLAIFVTSNKGLCGAFNFNLFRHFLSENKNLDKYDFIVIGKKGASFVSRLGGKIVADFSSDKTLGSVTAVIDFAVSNFLEGNYSKVLVFYNQFISTLRTEPTSEILLPFSQIKKEEPMDVDNYLVEPAPEEIIDELLRNYIEERLRYIFLQNQAGEHSSRMIAMKNATDNATEVIYNLTLLRNKLRQQKITYELLDMVTAKESVEAN